MLDQHKAATDTVCSLLARRTAISTIRAKIREEFKIELTARDVYNMAQKRRNAELEGKTSIQWLADELQKRDFFHRVDTDEYNRVTRLFFAHPESIHFMRKNPDVLIIDATYKTNRFNMPLINICGATGDNKTPQFAIAFVSGEKEEDYSWVIKQLMALQKQENISSPRCFVTDRELALLKTLEKLFPLADHILCRWHVNMNVVAKVKKNFKTQEEFDKFYTAWQVLTDARSFEDYQENLAALKKLNATAFKYVEKTWLVWREKIVSLDQSLRFDH